MRLLCQLVIKCKFALVVIQLHDGQRNFSEEALAMLLVWGELDVENIDAPICEYCYEDLRDVLIDRAGEIEVMHKDGLPKEVEQMIVNTIQPFRAENKAV